MRRLLLATAAAGAWVTLGVSGSARADVAALAVRAMAEPPVEAPAPLAAEPPAAPAVPDKPSKKERFLAEKGSRPAVHLAALAVQAAAPALTLYNMWTHEVLPIPLPGTAPAARAATVVAGRRRPGPPPPVRVAVPVATPGPADEERFNELVRCHYTNQATTMDPRLLDVVLRASAHFGTRVVEIVSGFRAPKYQLVLRKKGHEVARDSEHPRGHAVDFRLAGVKTKQLLAFVKSLHVGGVGFYPESRFVHADVGRVRFWRGH